jgi:hypothetical protein
MTTPFSGALTLLAGAEWDKARALWTAVLIQAAVDLSGKDAGKGLSPIIKSSAKRWFLSPADHIGSFVWVCEILGLDPARTRKAAIASQGKDGFKRILYKITALNAEVDA